MTEAEIVRERIARLETAQIDLTRQVGRELEIAAGIHASIDRSIAKLSELAEKVDTRQDRIERTVARLLGALAVLVVFANIVGPILVEWIVKRALP